jgi:V-type H+-transporting ATPase subunit a
MLCYNFTLLNISGKDGELSGGLYLARWMILMMGLFSVYAGVIYNDYFSIAVNLFGTKYTWPEGRETPKGTV